YGFLGAGKFAATFLPDGYQLSSDPATNNTLCALILTALTTLYVVKGGMFSVVFTEVLQFFIMTVACVAVGVIAIQAVSPEMIDAATPAGWRDLTFGWRLGLDWSGKLDAANAKIAADGWELFSVFMLRVLDNGLLSSAAGPTPGYDMQRVLSTRTPREAALMSGIVSLVLLVPRYMLIAGLTVLALAFFTDELTAMGGDVDFEQILPLTMRDYIPHGLLGLLMAALLAAFMSTYAATVNSAPAYVVNDVYRRYLNPDASDRTLVRLSYAASVAVVVAGIVVGLAFGKLGDIVNWVVAGLYGGYLAANVLKWHWWRFNSWGYVIGMACGVGPAMLLAVANTLLLPDARTLLGIEKNLALFPLLLAISTAGGVAGSLLTPPDDMAVLKEFYRKVRPWGFWGPVHRALLADYPDLQPNRDFGRDVVNVLVGIAWQTALTCLGISLVLQDYQAVGWSAAVIIATSVFLKFNWYDRLQDYPDHAKPEEDPSHGQTADSD
ncbi:MAG: sodium:solute symporter, partial [Planctomycetota bacterium]